MKKASLILLILFTGVFIFNGCVSTPGEKTDELDQTRWIFLYPNARSASAGPYERYSFRNGRYTWEYYHLLQNFVSTDSARGTYVIEDNKIILTRQTSSGSQLTITAIFSEDRRSFSYQDRVFIIQ